MMLDALLQLSSAQAVTATAFSTNTIDLGVARDVGAGEDLYAVFGVDETATAAGNATVTFQVVSSANANLSSPHILSSTDAIPIADLVAGRAPINLCVNAAALTSLPQGERYLGVQYTIATGPLTAGKFTCYISDSEVTTGKNYASGFTVS